MRAAHAQRIVAAAHEHIRIPHRVNPRLRSARRERATKPLQLQFLGRPRIRAVRQREVRGHIVHLKFAEPQPVSADRMEAAFLRARAHPARDGCGKNIAPREPRTHAADLHARLSPGIRAVAQDHVVDDHRLEQAALHLTHRQRRAALPRAELQRRAHDMRKHRRLHRDAQQQHDPQEKKPHASEEPALLPFPGGGGDCVCCGGLRIFDHGSGTLRCPREKWKRAEKWAESFFGVWCWKFGVGSLAPRSGVAESGHAFRDGKRLRRAKLQTPNFQHQTPNEDTTSRQ